MADFRFVHAADIHLDSPLHGLSRYDGVPADDIRGATRNAFDNLIRFALDEAVDFVLIAGDAFDGDWRDMGTGLYFARAMGRLNEAGIPVYLLAGNHDAASVLTRSVPWPANVHRFATKHAETHVIEALGVAIHGHSFANAAVTDNIALGYPAVVAHHFNIGMLHTSLTGHADHERYAPCSVEDLRARGYDYWALGHVHDYQCVCEDPPVIFPGNLQGRTIRETGPKGAVLVEVQDRTITAMTPIELDVLRWARAEVDCSTATDLEAVQSGIRDALARAHATGDGRPVIARVILHGETALAGTLADRASGLRDDARAHAAAISPDLWIEKLSVRVTPPRTSTVEVGDEFLALLAEAPGSGELAALLAADLAPFLTTTAAIGPADPDELRHAASAGDWSRLLASAATALEARLAQGGQG
ncbi:exonuclease SbcCD subunit D [Sphingomonas sp. R86520]|uniref:metallophosphoesterase family protein n=1 Tax=Sphingomonas sp. R86520 TaxID=3093859 RepID=UPI0036D3B877